MNVQHWDGYRDPRFGYGAMLHGFRDNAPKSVSFNEYASVNVFMGIPKIVKGWYAGQHRSIFTMWETTELPSDFWRRLPLFDQVIVPCQHNVEVFSQYHKNVIAVPLGVDTKFWTPDGTDTKRQGVFRFHAGGSLWRRKGLDTLVEAFTRLKLPNAELHIKAAPHAKDAPTKSPGPNIILHREWMTPRQQLDWFRAADCYVAPARGEGWGLMPLQAIAAGVPTIISNSSGQAEFCDLANHVVGCSKTKADTIGFWDEPNLQQLQELMKHHYQHRGAEKARALENAKLAKKYSWPNASKALVAALPTGTLLKDPEFVRPNVTVKIRVRRPVNADIGPNHYNLVPGQEYEVPEGVHQVLSDSGALEAV